MNPATRLMMEEFAAIKSHFGITSIPRPRLTVAQGWEKWRPFLEFRVQAGELRDSTRKKIELAMKSVIPFFGHKIIEELQRSDVYEYQEKRCKQPNTKHRRGGKISKATATVEIRALIAMLHGLKGEGLINENPLAGMPVDKKKRKVKQRLRVFTPDEISLQLRTARLKGYLHLAAVIAVMRGSGIRPGELIKLRWEDYDRAKGVLMVPDEIAKTAVARECVLLREGLQALEEIRRPDSPWLFPSNYSTTLDQHISYQSIDEQWRKTTAASGIAMCEDGSPPILYSLRHTLATVLGFELRWEAQMICDWMGWENLEQATDYLHVQNEHLAQQAKEIEDRNSAPPRKPPVRKPPSMAHMKDLEGLRRSPKRSDDNEKKEDDSD